MSGAVRRALSETMRVETRRLRAILSGLVAVLSLSPLAMADLPIPLPNGPVTTSIVVTAPRTTLTSLGETVQLRVTATLSDGATQDVTDPALGAVYQSADSGVATVSEGGLVTAVSKGTVTIFVNHGSLTAT